jgi:uncharacterized protein
MRHEYLDAMHRSGSAVPETGWSTQFVVLRDSGSIAAAAALYLKVHSYGEYVFDWSWADAYQRHGLRYYPKLLGAVPFTPVPGSRLLARDEHARRALAQAIVAAVQQNSLSSAHLLFIDDADQNALADAGWMMRTGVQFHWSQEASRPCATFDDLLQTLQREKRKKIQQERRRVSDAGVRFANLEGTAITTAHWDFFYRCYELTYAAHHSTPYLTRAFFSLMAATMPQHWVLFLAEQHGEPIACSLVAVDQSTKTVWGRYWGATKHIPCLHFEACYYQPLQWCLANGMRRFEGGAQGEHKMARGLTPVRTTSAHWLSDHRFAAAVDDALAREGAGMVAYLNELDERNPFKKIPLPTDPLE